VSSKADRGVPSRAEIRQRIRDAGLRATPGRIASYAELVGATAPLTHGEVVERLAPLEVDRATVYRNLIDLTDAGLLVRTDLGDHTWRFELAGAHLHGPDHVHFVCVQCGDVACLEDVEVRFRAGNSAPRSVADSRVEVQLRGRCDGCGS
jgi:Fur family ferric uptake transcriptional regulator